MGRVLTLGETMAVATTANGDPLRTARQLRLSVAGAEATVAIGLSRLGHEAVLVGVVGDDELGERVRREVAGEGVDVRFLRTTSIAPTGFMVRELRTPDSSTATYYRRGSAGATLSPDDVDRAFGGGAVDLVHITGITPALGDECLAAVRRAVSLAKGSGTLVSFDVNHRRTLAGSAAAVEVARELLDAVDVLFVGDDELWVLTDTADPECAARELISLGPSEVVVKRGAAGALAMVVDSDEPVFGPALETALLDVVGAGDSFASGYLAAKLDGAPVFDRLRWALTCAACTVATHGDWEGLPVRSRIEQVGSGRGHTLR
jgi:2-dehydro-3-deoxygluconokinase